MGHQLGEPLTYLLHFQDYAMNYWKNNGAPAEKLIVGFPAYGHNYILSNPSNNGIGAPTSGAGPAGPYTKQAGFLAYYEVGSLGFTVEILWISCPVLHSSLRARICVKLECSFCPLLTYCNTDITPNASGV